MSQTMTHVSSALPKEIDRVSRTCALHGQFFAARIKFGGEIREAQCPLCIAEEARESHRQERVRDLEAGRQARLERKLEQAALPERFRGCTFDNYEVDGGKRQAANLDHCRNYAETFPERKAAGEGIVMMGLKGTGKTHLAAAIVSQVIAQHGATAAYTLSTRMFRRLKDTYGRSDETEGDVIRAYASPDLLVIDEIGLGHCSPTELGHLFEIVNERYERRLPTIFVTNVGTSEELEAWVGERVMDRIREAGAGLLFDWGSYRAR